MAHPVDTWNEIDTYTYGM